MVGHANANKIRGMAAEGKAADWLKDQGHKILERNATYGGAELDIISSYKKTVYFCEVKARKIGGQTSPYEMITPAKAERLRRGASVYLAQNGNANTECIICLIAVWLDEKDEVASIELIPDII